MMQPEFAVVGLGTIVVDHLVVLPTHPEIDTKNAVVADHLQVGGPVPTALAMLRRLGRKCAFMGSWSNDAFGSLIEADLQREEICNRASMRRTGGRTGFAHVWVCQKSARRTIAYHRSTQPIAPEELNYELIRSSRAIHLDGWPPATALAAAAAAKENDTLVALDAGSYKPGIEELIGRVDILNAPRRFLQQLFGEVDVRRGIEQLLSLGPSIVTVTNGSAGAAIGTSNALIEMPAFQVEAVDTTGAGDVFTGALVHAALEDWPPAEMLSFAMAAAALKCRGLGNRDPLPSLISTRSLMNSHRDDSHPATAFRSV